jgi:general secretion pathway protein D
MKKNKVPLLGDIPGLGYLFKYEEEIVSTQELIVIIEPHIINKSSRKLSLSQLGYDRINPHTLNKKIEMLRDSNKTK